RLELRSDVEREVDVLRPDARGEAVARVVGEIHGLLRRAEGEADDDRTEDLLLRDRRGGRDVGEQRRRVVPALLGNRPARLEAVRAVGLALLGETLDLAQLHGRDDRADVDALAERRALAQRLHALAQLRLDLCRDALLDQQTTACATDLPLVEPDGVDDPFYRAVEVGVVEDDERRLAAELEGQLDAAARGRLADDAADPARAGERA